MRRRRAGRLPSELGSLGSPDRDFDGPRRLIASEAEAVEKLYRIAAPRLFSRALFLAQGNRDQADDLIQQVFQAAIMSWARISHWDSERQETWLYGVLHHKAADAWRVGVREHPVADLIWDQLQSPQDTAHDALCSMALDHALKAVTEMPPVRHRVVCLRVLAGLSTREVANLIGISPSTVRVHLKAARDTLSKEVGPIVPFVDDDPGDDGLPQEGW